MQGWGGEPRGGIKEEVVSARGRAEKHLLTLVKRRSLAPPHRSLPDRGHGDRRLGWGQKGECGYEKHFYDAHLTTLGTATVLQPATAPHF